MRQLSRAALGILLWLGLVLGGLAPQLAEAQMRGEQGASAPTTTPIVVGADHNFPPYEFLDKDGQPAGYNVELTRAIAEVMGLDGKIVMGGWDTMRKALDDGKIDVLQGMAYFEWRTRFYDFSPPHAIVHHSVFARRGDPAVDMAGLRGKEVIVQHEGVMHDYLRVNDVGAKLVTTDTHADALRLLASGKHDYALVANLPSLYLGRELGLTNIVPVAKPLVGRRYGYAVRKGETALLAQFSEGLAILKNTGRHQAIYDKWLGPLENEGGIPWKRLGLVGAVVSGGLLLVLGGIVVWNRMLQKKVDSRTEELRQHQQQLIQADKMTSLGVLVSGVAHEINNPSGLLLLNLPVLQEAYRDSQEVLEEYYRTHGDFMLGGLEYSRMREEIPLMLDEMLEGTQRIKRIVEDLKDFARQGNADQSETVDLNTVVRMAIRLVDNSIRKSTRHFSVHYGEDLPCLRGNAQRIEQVVINLILNACHALEAPEQGISVATRYDAAEAQLVLEVHDQGIGIPSEHLANLTDPFFTTKREAGGTGLGLSVSAGIVQEHNGTLEFVSDPGEGTTVKLRLPAAMNA